MEIVGVALETVMYRTPYKKISNKINEMKHAKSYAQKARSGRK